MSTTITIWQSILIGGTGGFFAGITIYLTKSLVNKIKESIDSRRVYKWLKMNTSSNPVDRWITTIRIASYNNLSVDRVRYLCSKHRKIQMNPTTTHDTWTIFPKTINPLHLSNSSSK